MEEELLKGRWVAVLLLKWERGLVEEMLELDVAGVCIRKLAEAGEGEAGEVDRQEEAGGAGPGTGLSRLIIIVTSQKNCQEALHQ